MRRWISHEGGSSAAEFAMVLPVFLLLTLGVIHLGLMMFATSNLHATVEAAARCYALAQTGCETELDTQNHALAIYQGPTATPTFDATDPESGTLCGYRVQGEATYNFSAGLVNLAVPIAADACFPELG